MATFARPVPHAFSALQVEAEACRAGLLMVIHQEWSNVDLESDGSMLVSALAYNSLDGSTIGLIVEDCKDYMAEISCFTVRHVYG